MPEENPAEFEALRQDWLGDFQPAAPTALELVEQTAQAHWLYLRVLKQWDGWEERMGLDPLAWKEEDCKMRERLGRYKTTAERSFQRALTAIEARRKSRMAEFALEARLEQAGQRIELSAIYKRDQVRLAEERVGVQKAAVEERARENARRAEERAAARKVVACGGHQEEKEAGVWGGRAVVGDSRHRWRDDDRVYSEQ